MTLIFQSGVMCSDYLPEKSENKLQEETSSLLNDKETIVVYKTRWLALGVFMLHMISNNAIWITFSPIASIAQCYYEVSLFWINALSWVYMLAYALFIIPAMWFLERFGLKWTAVVGGSMNAAGAWLRFVGADPSLFWVLFTGQIITSVTYLIENNGCSKLSAIWFPPQERAIATTLYAMISSQFGVLIGLLIGPLVISGGGDILCNKTLQDTLIFDDTRNETHNKFFYYLLGQAIFATLILPVTFIMPEAPPTPPSITSHIEKKLPNHSFLYLIREAFQNHYFLLFLIVSGVLTASGGAYTTVFEEVLHNAGYKHDQRYIGYLGSSMTIASIIGLLAMGRWIDYSKKFFCTTVALCFASTIATVALSVTVQFNCPFYIVFIVATITSGFLSLIGAVSFEYAVEMTFPLPESISAGLLNVTMQIISLLMIVVVGLLVQHQLALYGNYIFTGTLLFSSVLMVFVRPKLRRVSIEHEKSIQ